MALFRGGPLRRSAHPYSLELPGPSSRSLHPMPGHRSIYIRSVAERAGALEEYPSDRTVLVSSCIQGEEETMESPSQGPAD